MKQVLKQGLASLARLQSSSLWKEADAIFTISLTDLALLSSAVKDMCSCAYELGKGTYPINQGMYHNVRETGN